MIAAVNAQLTIRHPANRPLSTARDNPDAARNDCRAAAAGLRRGDDPRPPPSFSSHASPSRNAAACSPCPARASCRCSTRSTATPASRPSLAARKAARRSWPAPTARSPGARAWPSSPAGPGATNASIGVHVAFQDSQPLILFVGDVARGMRGREGFQEIDFPGVLRPDSQMGRADRRRGAHSRIHRPRLCHRDLRPPRPGRARAAGGHAVGPGG